MNFFCISDKESGTGFRLAGIATREVDSRAQALDALAAARGDKELGIILVTARAADLMREEIALQISENPLPLVLEIPSKGEFRPRKSASEFLRQIAGM